MTTREELEEFVAKCQFEVNRRLTAEQRSFFRIRWNQCQMCCCPDCVILCCNEVSRSLGLACLVLGQMVMCHLLLCSNYSSLHLHIPTRSQLRCFKAINGTSLQHFRFCSSGVMVSLCNVFKKRFLVLSRHRQIAVEKQKRYNRGAKKIRFSSQK